MKKAFTLLFILIVLISGMTLRYSEHYCQGILVASKISISGDNAGCGMNREENGCTGAELSSLMCVNEIVLFTFSDNYVYSSGNRESCQQLRNTGFPFIITPKENFTPVSSTELRQPPSGVLNLFRSECEVLCVFRI